MAKESNRQYEDWRTPFFVARYPKISQPDTKGKYADAKFKTDGVFLDDATLKEAEKHLKAVAKKFWPDAAEVQIPVKNFYKNADDRKAKKIDSRGITLKSKDRPAVYDSKNKKLPEGVSIGGGSIIRVNATIASWSKSEKVKIKDSKTGEVTEEDTILFGVNLYLNDVQVKKLVVGRGDGEGFADDEIEDGFEYEGEAADETGSFGDATDL